MSQSDFLSRLEKEAALQAKLHQRALIPTKFGALTSFVARYPWQTSLVLSGLTALALELL